VKQTHISSAGNYALLVCLQEGTITYFYLILHGHAENLNATEK